MKNNFLLKIQKPIHVNEDRFQKFLLPYILTTELNGRNKTMGEHRPCFLSLTGNHPWWAMVPTLLAGRKLQGIGTKALHLR